ncbi:hypothetical protein ZWY2020_010118 [Hordeum vulgare]|nr:hypothetical protein ZWY2020_010118 [Hordeum vulgare]
MLRLVLSSSQRCRLGARRARLRPQPFLLLVKSRPMLRRRWMLTGCNREGGGGMMESMRTEIDNTVGPRRLEEDADTPGRAMVALLMGSPVLLVSLCPGFRVLCIPGAVAISSIGEGEAEAGGGSGRAAERGRLAADCAEDARQDVRHLFEEINHAGAGGLWAELKANRVLCGSKGTNVCPSGGVGVYNPGYWALHIRSSDAVSLTVSLTSSDGLHKLASHHHVMLCHRQFIRDAALVCIVMTFIPWCLQVARNTADWTKIQFRLLYSSQNNTNSRLQITTSKTGWSGLARSSVGQAPSDTYMVRLVRFSFASESLQKEPCLFLLKKTKENDDMYVFTCTVFELLFHYIFSSQGHGFRKDLASMLANLKPQFLKFPVHTDIYLLQLAEDLGASPVCLGASINEEVPYCNNCISGEGMLFSTILMLLMVSSLQGRVNTTWGSVRVAMGHPQPFKLDYAITESSILRLKLLYPDINIISSCDKSTISASNPADLYDVHVYASSANMFSRTSMFDNTPRSGPKAIVSEYAVTGNDAGKGTLLAALAEAAFLMASCAPLFVNDNDRKWSPDAIVFNSWQHYGCPNYWMLHFFKDSSGATFHPTTTQVSNYDQMVASAITWQSPKDKSTYLKIKVAPVSSPVADAKEQMGVSVSPYSSPRSISCWNPANTRPYEEENHRDYYHYEHV